MSARLFRPSLRLLSLALWQLAFVVACSSNCGSSNTAGTGGMSATGGQSTGGAATGGKTMDVPGTGGAGGQTSTGGNATGGGSQGGKAGDPTGGSGPGGGVMGGTSGGGGSSAGCQDSSLLFCEDFEGQTTATPTSTKWTNEVSTGATAGTLTIDNMHSRGQKALHIHTLGNGRGLIHVKNFAPPANSFYGRMWMWVDAFPTAPDYAHFTMVEAAGTGNASKVRPIGGQFISASNGSFWGAGSDGGPSGDWTKWKTSAPTKSSAWVCVQWQMDATKNAIAITIDGQAKPDLSVSTKDHTGSGDFVFPTFNDVWFGWWLYHANPTPDHFDIWLDDLALGTSLIPCGAKQ